MYKIILFLISFLLLSCDNGKFTKIEYPHTFNGRYIDNHNNKINVCLYTIEVDSCEYLVGSYDRSRYITHKGNCKFCEERKILKSVKIIE